MKHMLPISTGNVLRDSKCSRQPTVLNILSEKHKRKRLKHQPTSCIARESDLMKNVFSSNCSRNHVNNGGYHGNSNENWYCLIAAHGDRFIRMACRDFCHDTNEDFTAANVRKAHVWIEVKRWLHCFQLSFLRMLVTYLKQERAANKRYSFRLIVTRDDI